jgi:predicted HicB family RNase H-like nuclease
MSVQGATKEIIGNSGKNLIHYKGYVGKIEFDEEASIFHGEVINLRDVITFEGETVSELKQAFEDSVDDYLKFCAERNEEPEKPFSGRFVIRIDPELHRIIATEAKKADVSINQWVTTVLSRSV